MSEASERRRRLLAGYARVAPVLLPAGERGFHRLLLVTVLGALGVGAGLHALEPAPRPAPAAAAAPAPFRWQQERRAARPLPPASALPAAARPRPPVAEPPARPPQEAAVSSEAATPTAAGESAPARRVYGVRQVYAQGLGAAGGPAALLTKRGNALVGPADSLAAAPVDAGGATVPGEVPLTRPLLVHQVKPRYSPAMLAARASGVVELRLLVGASGAVEAVEVLADIGLDSGELAAAACREFRFEPARRGQTPVAEWIRLSIRFELQE